MPKLMFQRPRRIEWEVLHAQFGRMIAEPFEKGYALTVGNSLRRVLLSAIHGAAVAWVKIDGYASNATRIQGVQEDPLTLFLNLKGVVTRLLGAAPVTARLDVTGPKVATAGDVSAAAIEVVNPEWPLCTVEAGARLGMELGIRSGRGYVTADRQAEPVPGGAVPLDSAFSPIRRVNYAVEMSRLGQITDYEKLVLEIWTNGTVTPDQALLRASQLLRDHFELLTPVGAEEEDEEPLPPPAVPDEVTS